MERKLIKYITNFQLSDLLGFARIVGANQKIEDFEDFVTEVIIKFLELPKKDRKNLFYLGKR